MQFWHKLASTGILALVLMLPLMPLLAMCAPQPGNVMRCPPDCPMMADMSSQHSGIDIKAKDPGSCCTIKSSTPAPVTTATVVPPIVSVESATVSIPLVAVTVSHHSSVDGSSPPLLYDSQAKLCTFLI
jgi:hypothetical protein